MGLIMLFLLERLWRWVELWTAKKPLISQSLIFYFVRYWKIQMFKWMQIVEDQLAIFQREARTLCGLFVWYCELRIYRTEIYYAGLGQWMVVSGGWESSCGQYKVKKHWCTMFLEMCSRKGQGWISCCLWIWWMMYELLPHTGFEDLRGPWREAETWHHGRVGVPT